MRGDFYAAPASVPDEPGVLLRHEPLTARWVPAHARAWRILYTTTHEDGRRALASGMVLAPRATDGGEAVNLVAWGHGTTGITSACAPSQLRKGPEAGAMLITRQVLDEGWAIVATDYIGLGVDGAPHPWMIGEPGGRAVLDSIRAARQVPALALRDRTVLWGHSQGGHAAIWAGQLAADYAPELELVGIAALAPGTNPLAIVSGLDAVFGGLVFMSYTIDAYSSYYPNVTAAEYVRPRSRRLVRQLSKRPLGDPRTIAALVIATALKRRIWLARPESGALRDRLVENIPSGSLQIPVLIAQGTRDEVVPISAQDHYVEDRRNEGHNIDYRRYEGLRHVSLVERDSPLIPHLLAWTHHRFAEAS